MQTRGVTRPMAIERAQTRGTARRNTRPSDGHDRDGLYLRHHRATAWVMWAVLLLGVWLTVAPLTFGYLDRAAWVAPSGGRGPWFAATASHASVRAWLTTWSDIASGLALVLLAWRSLKPDRPVARWAACSVGVWLVFAPVVLWSPTAAAFLNDSLVGALVIALTILIPGMPNMAKFMAMGPSTPPGWSYNPSSWAQRSVLIALGFVGLLVSRYLAAYQLGFIHHVWDPFFGFSNGTQKVLDSDMSHMWPISDAGLGAVAYTFEFLMGFMGSEKRWRTMPWMVAMFGVLVIPLGLSHIALVMSQPVVVHHWSTLALLAAAVMLPMVTLTVDEVVAMGQHMRDAIRRGDRGGSTWKVFWLGGEADGSTDDTRSPSITSATENPTAIARASVWGTGTPWNLMLSALLGVWLLVAPAAFGVDIHSGAADLAHLGGAFVIVVSVVALAEVVRTLRLLDVAAGAVVVGLAPFVHGPAGYTAALVLTGVAIAASSIRRGAIRETYGDWSLLTC